MMAVGTEADMNKIKELEAGDVAEEAPPKKKPRVDKAPKGRKRLGKENRNKPPSQPKKKKGKKGSIILVGPQPLLVSQELLLLPFRRSPIPPQSL